jgi:hypothetical protein
MPGPKRDDDTDPNWFPDGAISLGPGHFYTKSTYDGEYCGIIEWHWAPTKDAWCGGWVPFSGTEYAGVNSDKFWTVNSFEPLDLSPSLLCTMCSSHGFITNGKWVEC